MGMEPIETLEELKENANRQLLLKTESAAFLFS